MKFQTGDKILCIESSDYTENENVVKGEVYEVKDRGANVIVLHGLGNEEYSLFAANLFVLVE